MIDLVFLDDDIEMTEREARALDVIMASDCEDIVGLVAHSGYDTTTFFEAGDWEGLDFRGSSVLGMSFRDANMSRVKLYRDQLEHVRKSGPKSLHKAEIQESRDGGKSDLLTTILDRPINPAEARADFKRILDVVVQDSLKLTKVDWNRLAPYVSVLDVPLGRLWGLQMLLDEFSRTLPPARLLEQFSSGFSADAKTAVGETILANRLISICQRDSVDERVAALIAQSPMGSDIDRRLQQKLPEVAVDLEEMERVVTAFRDSVWPILPELFLKMIPKLRFSDIEPFLNLMDKAQVKPDAVIFRNLAENVKIKDEIVPFLNIMGRAAVKPDAAVFNKLTLRLKTLEDIGFFLDLMEKASVKPDTTIFGKLAQRTKTINDIGNFLNLMKKSSVQPDTTVFANLAERTKTMDDFRFILDTMTETGVEPSTAVFRKLAERARTTDDFQPFLNLMEKARVRPDTVVFGNLAQRTKTMDDIEPFLNLMANAGVQPDTDVLGTLAERTKSTEDFQTILELIEKAGLKPDVGVFKKLAERTKTKDDIKPFLKLMAHASVKPDIGVFRKLAERTKIMDDFHPFLDLMERAGVKPDSAVFGTLAQRAKAVGDIDPFLSLMENAGVKPDTIVFRSLAERTKTMDDFQPFLDLMEKARVRPDSAVFQKFAERTKTMDDVNPFLDLMERYGVRPDTSVFSMLAVRTKTRDDIAVFRGLLQQYDLPETVANLRCFIGACSSVEEAEIFFELLDVERAKPSETELNRLLSNAETGTAANEIWDLFDRFGLQRSHITFNALIQKQENWDEAWNVFKERRPPNVISDGYTFSHLVSKARSRQNLKMVFEILRHVRIDARQLHALLKSHCSDSDVLWAFDQFRKRGLDAKTVDPETMGVHAERFLLLLPRFR